MDAHAASASRVSTAPTCLRARPRSAAHLGASSLAPRAAIAPSVANASTAPAPAPSTDAGDARAVESGARRLYSDAMHQRILTDDRYGYRPSCNPNAVVRKIPDAPHDDALHSDLYVASLDDLPREYDAVLADQFFGERPWLAATRVVGVAAGLTAFVTRAGGWEAVLARFRSGAEGTPVRPDGEAARVDDALVRALPKFGPTFVKLAQTMATRADVLGDRLAEGLSELQDSAPPMTRKELVRVLMEEFPGASRGMPGGAGRDSVAVGPFARFDLRPVAAASLGQVHYAVLADGRKVAVKVQRPTAMADVSLDVYLLRKALGVVRKAAKVRRDLGELADEIGAGLYQELDYREEGRNSEEFARAHAGRIPGVAVPGVVWEHTTRRVLVTEWVPGSGVSQLVTQTRSEDPEVADAARARLKAVVRTGVQCSVSQLVTTGVMHADPHPGNLMLANDSDTLFYLDFGLLTRVPAHHRVAMMSALAHIATGEWRAFVEDLSRLGMLKAASNKDAVAETARTAFLSRCPPAEGQSAEMPDLSRMTLSAVTGAMADIGFVHRLSLPPYYTLVARSLATMEGLALAADPEFKIVQEALLATLTELAGDPRQEARELLFGLMFRPEREGGGLRLDLLRRLTGAAESGDEAAASSGRSAALLLSARSAGVRRVVGREMGVKGVLKQLSGREGARFRQAMGTAVAVAMLSRGILGRIAKGREGQGDAWFGPVSETQRRVYRKRMWLVARMVAARCVRDVRCWPAAFGLMCKVLKEAWVARKQLISPPYDPAPTEVAVQVPDLFGSDNNSSNNAAAAVPA
ncbi:unnamed protein product [Pedinophyceae sp. YPF-701]|nr:unnamed protein product [Pedinophyceae sp. YPF-701]